jgi:hypothetical protein
LINEVGPAIEEVVHKDQEVWFQQDGRPTHFGVNVITHLNQAFPNRWLVVVLPKLAGQIS